MKIQQQPLCSKSTIYCGCDVQVIAKIAIVTCSVFLCLENLIKSKANFGTAPVFLTAISTILGAIMFLRFGYAVGSLGFIGALIIILVGHLVTIPTAMAIAESQLIKWLREEVSAIS